MTAKKAGNGNTVANLMANLDLANEVRARKRQFREDIAKMPADEACKALADRLMNDPGAMPAVRVEHMLMAIQNVGRSRASSMARMAKNTSLTDRVDRLPEFRRQALADVLLDRAGGSRAAA